MSSFSKSIKTHNLVEQIRILDAQPIKPVTHAMKSLQALNNYIQRFFSLFTTKFKNDYKIFVKTYMKKTLGYNIYKKNSETF